MHLQVLESESSDFKTSCVVDCGKNLRHLPGRRNVWQAVSEDREILVKVYDPHPKQQRDVSREWDNAKRLAEAQLEVPQPLFLVKSESGQIAVGFEWIPDGETVDRTLSHAEATERAKIFQQLVSLHERQHAAGILQSDDHLGNYLWSRGQLWMLDAGTCLFSDAPLEESKRVENMAVLAANIPLGLRQTYDAAVAEHYGLSLTGLVDAIPSSIQNRARKYYKKTRRSCSDFEHHKENGKEWLACRDFSSSLKSRLQEDPDQFFTDTSWLKDGNTCTVVEVKEGETSYILKRYNEKSLSYRLRHALLTPRALMSWSNGHVLRLFGVPTPRPLACLLVRNGPLLKKAYLLMEKADGAALDQISEEDLDRQMPVIADQFVQRWHELDALQVTHGDMKSGNFMFSEDGLLSLIDLDGTTFHQTAAAHQQRKEKDLARFLRNWEKRPDWISAIRAKLDASS
ncbi:phosphotransferase [Verrucomicrobiaceae bacterium 5K15]|uniref:Phosphotransferase n=1 Tax=Oceaniferula flava TaxID=2800421 RepID=A0AAE2S983_9BACT|nr:phosphotransferase [Oceaniferula flavus]MBK1853595.1 phosphotransferase [Oceaniferula flavus]MBM1134900.1 phosphotransferase [Oceaniferula flavus]